MIVHVASRVIGLVVDAVSDVIRLAQDEVKPAPDFGAVVDSTCVAGLATQADRMVVLLDIERFLSSTDLNLLGKLAPDEPLAA